MKCLELDAAAVEALAKKRVVKSLLDQSGAVDAESVAFSSECGKSLMKMQAQEHGAYCYVLDGESRTWMFGASMSQELKQLVDFIER